MQRPHLPHQDHSFKTPTSPALLSFSFIVPITVWWEPCCERSHKLTETRLSCPCSSISASAPVEIPSISYPPLGLPWSYSVEFSKTLTWPQACSLSTHTAMARKEPWNKQKCLSPEGTEVTVEAANQTHRLPTASHAERIQSLAPQAWPCVINSWNLGKIKNKWGKQRHYQFVSYSQSERKLPRKFLSVGA